jgi:hypothetical protein
MLRCAFPDGLEAWAYLATILTLYEYMSDRSLAVVVSEISEHSYEQVLNDVYKVGGDPTCCRADDICRVVERLQRCGFEKWKEEP